jgi:hypothetical protein
MSRLKKTKNEENLQRLKIFIKNQPNQKKFFKNILKQIFRKTLKNTFYQIISESKEKKKFFLLSGIENLNKIIRKKLLFFFSKTKKLFFPGFQQFYQKSFMES